MKAQLASAETPEEKAAAQAYKRVTAGTVVLAIMLVLGLAVLTPLCMIPLEEGTARTGTVQADGQVRYTDNVHRYVTLEQLGLHACGLQAGDRVRIYFDTVTGEITAAYTEAYAEQYTNTRLSFLLGYMVFMAAALLIYAIVICRYTRFGSAWYLYVKRQRKKDAGDIPLGARIVIYAVSAVIAVLLCWPSLQNILENVRQMQRIGAMQEQIRSAQQAAEDASNMAQALETVGQGGEASEAIEEAGSAADHIWEILDALNGD